MVCPQGRSRTLRAGHATFAKSARSRAGHLLEDANEVGLRSEAGCLGDLRHRRPITHELSLRGLYATHGQIVVRRLASRLTKQAGKMVWAETRFAREIAQRNVPGVVSVDVVEHACKPFEVDLRRPRRSTPTIDRVA